MSDPKGAGFGLPVIKAEGAAIPMQGGGDPDAKNWTYLEARVPRVLEHELYDMVIAKIKERGYKK